MSSSKTKAIHQFLSVNDDVQDSIERIFKKCPWEDARFYAIWCGQFYYFVAHATRLLAASAARLRMDRDPLHIRFIDHCQEEKHHEQLFLRDIEALGFSIDDIPEFPMTANLYQSQYYLIDYHDPVALFGSIFYLEGMSLVSAPDVYRRTREAHGDVATSFLRVHVNEDQDHMEKAHAALNSLTEEQLKLVEWSLRQSASVYECIMAEALKRYESLTKRKAA